MRRGISLSFFSRRIYMTIKECIDIVDNLKPNQYSIEDKVEWLSFLDQTIINDVFLTHEGYHGEYDDFVGYSPDNLSVPLIVPSPYDRLYTAYLKMKIDEENGETTRYNNSATMFNAYMTEYKRWYNKTHMPIDVHNRKPCGIVNNTYVLSDAMYENLRREVLAEVEEEVTGQLSDDRIYDIIMRHVYTHTQEFKGKDGENGKSIMVFTSSNVSDDGSTYNFDRFKFAVTPQIGDLVIVPNKNMALVEVAEVKPTTVCGTFLGNLQGEQGIQGEKGERGPQGPAGSDATVTDLNIKAALGYTPADKADVSKLQEEIVDLRDGTPIYIKWNGDVTDLESITIGNSTLYKVSDDAYSQEALSECEIVAVMTTTGAVMKLALSDCEVLQDASEYIAFKVPENTGFDVVAVAIVKEDTDTMKKGTYFIELNGIGYIKALGNVYLGYPTWNEIKDKPFESLDELTEEWIFTLEDGSTVTKKVVLG